MGLATGLYAIQDHGIAGESFKVGTASAGAVLTTVTAYLLLLRMRRTQALSDVLLTATFTLRALASVAMVFATSAALPAGSVSSYAVIAVGASMAVGLGLAVAAFLPPQTLQNPERTLEGLFRWGVLLATLTIGAIALTLALVGSAGHEATLILGNLIAAALAAVATAGFVRRADSGEGRLFMWFGMAAAIAAVAQFADAALPWSRVDDLSSGDVIQLAGWLALLLACVRDMQTSQQEQTVEAVVQERRRLARELHDGLAQELAYITSETRRDPTTRHLADAAERALEESRAAIAALTCATDQPLERALSDAASSIAARSGIEVAVAIRPGLDVTAQTRIALLRILREAMANSIRHGRAQTIHLSLDGPSPLVMAVADDGCGFELKAPRRPDAFGLQSMRERAENLNGHMSVESRPGSGTTVAVVLP